MTLSIGTGDFNYYNNNNNDNVKVPYRPGEGPKEEEIIIPLKSEEAPENAPEDSFVVKTGHSASATAGFSTVDGPSISVKPYQHVTEITNNNTTMKLSVGPELKIAGMGAPDVSPLNIFPGKNATGIGAGLALSAEVSKDMPAKNMSIYGSVDGGVRYQHVAAANTPDNYSSIDKVYPSANAVDLDLEGRVGVNFKPDDKNSVRLFTFGKVQALAGKQYQEIIENPGNSVYSEPPQKNSKQTSAVQSFGAGVEYTRKLKKGDFSVEASGGYGLRTTQYMDLDAEHLSWVRSHANGGIGTFKVAWKF